MIHDYSIRTIFGAGALVLAGALAAPPVAGAADGEALLRSYCLTCHTEQGAGSGGLSRINEMRKSPEGWHMTMNRMQNMHGLTMPPEDKRAVIKHLADTRGLAPAEAEPWRYLLEQDTNRVEDVAEPYAEMCARCHSGARFALQRRSAGEWALLVHTHMGQNPTLELHALSRDRPWMQLALDETAPALAADFPLDSAEWRAWQAAVKPELAGSWRLVGHVPGKGEFDARMTAEGSAADGYTLRVDGRYLDGSRLSGRGSATVYTGYEWRGTLELDGVPMRQVMAAAADGAEMQGRMFRRDARELGGELRAVREGATGQVIAALPGHLRRGETGIVTIVGSRLAGNVSLGAGVRVLEVLSRDADRVVVRARADGANGLREVRVGTARGAGMLAVYDRIARVEVLPHNAVARVGGPGDAQMEKVRVAYRAVAYAAGPDGEAGTDDDIRLGPVPVSWSIEPADDDAAEADDHVFAGSIDADGLFTPGDAGPNPKRSMSGGNTGRLAVVATVAGGAEPVEGRASLLVAAPDFVRRVLD